ncbi:MAG: DsbA family oxidoreductase [Myxococcota bacterium]
MTLTIDIVSDVVCPWCYIGASRLEAVLAETGASDAVVRYHPFFLDPSVPPEGRDIVAWLRSRYGRDPTPMFARVEAEARKGGLALDLSRQRMTYRTERAHALLAAADERGTQRALAKALFAAHFDQALNISDPEVLADIGVGHGCTRDEALAIVTEPSVLDDVRRAAEHASAQGISGVPFFVMSGPSDRFALSGAQPLDVFRQALRQLDSGSPGVS